MTQKNQSVLQAASAYTLPWPNNGTLQTGRLRSTHRISHGFHFPLIPDVSIHYRCGDNVVGNYGFLPFTAFADHINPTATKSIYILAESSRRKMLKKKNQLMGEKCGHILNALTLYISEHFPHATVVLLRGGNMYNDLVRLTYSKQSFCSVSTFCFWPALITSG